MSGAKQPVPGREYVRRHYTCDGCKVRKAIGTPKATAAWPSHLALTAEQVKWLTAAAAEYRDLCDEAGEYEHAVDFMDWVAVDALREGSGGAVNLSGERQMDRNARRAA